MKHSQKWPEIALGKIANFRNGINYTRANWGKGIKVINVKDFQDRNYPPYQELDEINPKGVVKKEDLLKTNDILFVRSCGNRQLIGRSLFIKEVPEEVTHSGFTIRVRFSSNAEARFYSYVFKTSFVRQTLSALGGGTNINNLNQKILSNLIVPFPPIETQRRIVAVLSDFDNLLEINTTLIETIEELASSLYHEWFVSFRFPGNENAAPISTKDCSFPKGWRTMKLADLVTTQYGYTESAKADPVGPKFLRGMDINKSSHIDWYKVPYCTINKEEYEKFKLAKNDILIIRMADPGKVGIVEKEVNAVFASYLIRLKIKSDLISPYYLYYFLLSGQYQGYVTGASTGTTRKSASAEVVVGTSIVIPSKEILNRFEDTVSSLRALLSILVETNNVLCQMRDLILPKLTSGELDVKSLDVTSESE